MPFRPLQASFLINVRETDSKEFGQKHEGSQLMREFAMIRLCP